MPDHIDYHNWKPKHNPWLVALTVTLATFMEVLDTSIANVALPHMQGELSASQDQIIEHCRPHLAAYKRPRSVRFVPDLPKTSTGKVMRRELKSLDN